MPLNTTRQLTRDTLYDGALICSQYRHGYRFSVDAVLAAHFCRINGHCKVLDLGCGSGIIGLVLAYLHPEVTIQGLDIQKELVDLTQDNICKNQLGHRFEVVWGDARHISASLPPESFDLVVCNPPYRKCGSGRVSREDQAAIARHELKAELADMLAAAAFCVKNRGTVVLVYPAVRFAHLASGLAEKKLALKRLQPVYSYPEDVQARLMLVEAVKNGGEECRILPPLYIYCKRDGAYSRQIQQMYEPKPAS
ncbi:MAG TPA: methyltransferase domain-containing protein [Desulfobulbus sp.]|nr:methyltransferase domain-containing protein [Desulfobulbus sp.]